MTLKIISSGSDQGSPYNEDLYGAVRDRVWLLDGATGLAPSRFENSSDAQWLVRAFSDYFSTADGDTVEVLKGAIDTMRAQYIATGPLPEVLYAMPSTGLSMVREVGADIEIASLADVKAYVVLKSGEVQVIGGGPLEALDAALADELVKVQAVHGAMDLKASRAHVEHIIRANREKMNRDGGYWVLSLDPVCLTGLEVVRIPTEDVSHILLATDGFYDLWERYEPKSFAKVVHALMAGKGEALITRLRAIERHDEWGEQFPRVKLHDDASWVLIEVGL
ncbi:protein phosphatase 2C domain-containing protein [Asticcacaulis tiandongensis]|uniref:protein phosphatase 2C domain-containing protein n=1 Tax=Asticcacaulis tiandongensis TaxID=2565365 RepID=UPI0011263CCE|nr:protein phosphatase 2C domain-containing protein [Asticcacaulis tiandongensis]